MIANKYVIGVDFGTDSVRSVLVDSATGKELVSSFYEYPRWRDGLYCDASINQFRQHPLDYIEGLEYTIKKCLQQAGDAVRNNIKAISVDTTGSTPVAVDKSGTPLSLLPAFKNNPHAMFILWKDHTAVEEAIAINNHAKKYGTNYLQYAGGIYSSEWFWAKLLHILKTDDFVRETCYSWVEHCDWIPFLLTGGTLASNIKRSVCTAGHKALWAEEFGGLPPEDFFASLHPFLKGFTNRLYQQTYTADKAAGQLSKEWTERLGLPANVLVGIGAMDAHTGAVGGQIKPYHLIKVMGTSTCDMLVIPKEKMKDVLVKGICGQVDGSIVPGMIGLEAGQSAFGDVYAWFKNLLLWPLQNLLSQSEIINANTAKKLLADIASKIIPELDRQATQLPVEENSELAIDWFNGRRTPDANHLLRGVISGLSLGSDASRIFRSLVEATCFGAKKITDRFSEEGIVIEGLIGAGGIAQKSPFVMQMMADVMNMPIKINQSTQTSALGAAMFAATVAGIYEKVEDAMDAMGRGFDKEYYPDKMKTELYNKRYQKYLATANFVERLK